MDFQQGDRAGAMDCGLYVYDEQRWASTVQKDYLIKEPALVREYDNAILEPVRYIPGTAVQHGDGLLEGGLCTRQFEFLAGLHRSFDEESLVNKSCIRSYEVDLETVSWRDETVIFGGILTSHFGHMLCDGTSRLWYMASHPDDETKVVFLVYPNQTFSYWELLELAGISRERVEIIKEPTGFAHVIVPDETSFSLENVGYKREWKCVLDRIREGIEPSTHKKVYFTRTQLCNDGCVGESYFEEFFRANGYHVVAPETLSFREQVSLVAGADEFACTMGTIAHQVMFAHEGAKQVVLNRSQTVVHVQPMMNQASNTALTLVDVYKNILPDSQAGGSVWFLTPTRHWDIFLEHSGLSPVDVPYSFEQGLCDYVKKWGSVYACRPKAYRWIRHESLIDVISRVNLYMNDIEIDRNKYLDPLAVSSLQREVREARIESSHFSETTVQAQGQAIAFYGRTVLPLLDIDEFSLELVLWSPAVGGTTCDVSGGLSLTPAIQQTDRPDVFAWQATCAAADFLALAQANMDNAVYGKLVIAHNGRSVMSTPFFSDEVEKEAFLPGVLGADHVLWAGEIEGSFALKALPWADALEKCPLAYGIEVLEWEGDALRLAGYMVYSFLPDGDMRYFLTLEPADAQEDPIRVPLALDVSDKEHSTRRATWQVSLPVRDFALQASAAPGRWYMELEAQHKGLSHSVPLGRHRPVGSFARFAWHILLTDDEACCVSIENADKTIGFWVDDIKAFQKRPLEHSIKTLEWRKNGRLYMEGVANHPLMKAPPSKLGIKLEAQNGAWNIEVPVHYSYDAASRKCRWTVLFDVEKALAGVFESGSEHMKRCCFKIYAQTGFGTVGAPFGKHRPVGTLAAYKAGAFNVLGHEVVPCENKDKTLGFDLFRGTAPNRSTLREIKKLLRG